MWRPPKYDPMVWDLKPVFIMSTLIGLAYGEEQVKYFIPSTFQLRQTPKNSSQRAGALAEPVA